MGDKKRRQHFVYQGYLRAWTNEEKLYCLRKANKTPFQTSTANVANKRDFYRIKQLNKEEILLFRLSIHKIKSNHKQEVYDFINENQGLFQEQKEIEFAMQLLVKHYGGFDSIPTDLVEALDVYAEELDVEINNKMENFYGESEAIASRWFNDLRQKNSDFYYSKGENNSPSKSKKEFLSFLCLQYFRTDAIRNRWSSHFEDAFSLPLLPVLGIDRDNVNLENIAQPFFKLLSLNLTDNLLTRNVPLTILINDSTVPFITSDQPLINLAADYNDLDEDLTELCFFYPISPYIAITINGDSSKKTVKINEAQVDNLNQKMIDASYEAVYASDQDIFKRYKI